MKSDRYLPSRKTKVNVHRYSSIWCATGKKRTTTLYAGQNSIISWKHDFKMKCFNSYSSSPFPLFLFSFSSVQTLPIPVFHMAKSCENLGHGPKLTTETINPIQCSSILHLLYAGRNCAMCQNIIRSHKAQIRVVKYWERRFVRWILNSFLEYIQRRLHGSMQWVRNSCFKENRPPKQAQIPNITH